MYCAGGAENVLLRLCTCTCVQSFKVTNMHILNAQQGFPGGFALESLRINVAANLRLHKLALSWSISLEADCGKTNQTATSMLKIA